MSLILRAAAPPTPRAYQSAIRAAGINRACAPQTFADAARPFAQRTERPDQRQCHLGLALKGEAGARLAERLAMPISADTLLRLVRGATAGLNTPCPARPSG